MSAGPPHVRPPYGPWHMYTRGPRPQVPPVSRAPSMSMTCTDRAPVYVFTTKMANEAELAVSRGEFANIIQFHQTKCPRLIKREPLNEVAMLAAPVANIDKTHGNKCYNEIVKIEPKSPIVAQSRCSSVGAASVASPRNKASSPRGVKRGAASPASVPAHMGDPGTPGTPCTNPASVGAVPQGHDPMSDYPNGGVSSVPSSYTYHCPVSTSAPDSHNQPIRETVNASVDDPIRKMQMMTDLALPFEPPMLQKAARLENSGGAPTNPGNMGPMKDNSGMMRAHMGHMGPGGQMIAGGPMGPGGPMHPGCHPGAMGPGGHMGPGGPIGQMGPGGPGHLPMNHAHMQMGPNGQMIPAGAGPMGPGPPNGDPGMVQYIDDNQMLTPEQLKHRAHQLQKINALRNQLHLNDNGEAMMQQQQQQQQAHMHAQRPPQMLAPPGYRHMHPGANHPHGIPHAMYGPPDEFMTEKARIEWQQMLAKHEQEKYYDKIPNGPPRMPMNPHMNPHGHAMRHPQGMLVPPSGPALRGISAGPNQNRPQIRGPRLIQQSPNPHMLGGMMYPGGDSVEGGYGGGVYYDNMYGASEYGACDPAMMMPASDNSPNPKLLQGAPYDIDYAAMGAVPQSSAMRGGHPPTVNNTYVNSHMTIQQMTIQNMGPPIQHPSGPQSTMQIQGHSHEGEVFPVEPLTNLESKIPSQKLSYFPKGDEAPAPSSNAHGPPAQFFDNFSQQLWNTSLPSDRRPPGTGACAPGARPPSSG